MSGFRKGFKRADKRWVDDEGREWDSRFEWQVYTALERSGASIRRCDKRDVVSYGTPVRGGHCVDCGSANMVQRRTYTSDIYVMGDESEDDGGGYLLELKGYWQAPKRTLFRYIAKQCQDEGINLRIVFENGRPMRGTKLTGPEYVRKYCKGVIAGVFDKKTGVISYQF
jgi:hypothetical protein